MIATRAWSTRILSVPFARGDRKSTRLNSSHTVISYAVFCLKKKNELCRLHHYVFSGLQAELMKHAISRQGKHVVGSHLDAASTAAPSTPRLRCVRVGSDTIR